MQDKKEYCIIYVIISNHLSQKEFDSVIIQEKTPVVIIF